MIDWRAHLRERLAYGQEIVLITLADIKGSVPQQSGAKLIVDQAGQVGTIGGGRLEWEATKKARQLLEQRSGEIQEIETFSLGKSLGQCCGGVVTLVFQRLSLVGLNQWLIDPPTQTQELFLMTPLDGSGLDVEWVSPEIVAERALPCSGQAQIVTHNAQQWLLEDMRDTRTPILIFGAGHVGQALMSVLTSLPFAPHWIDPRDDMETIAAPHIACAQIDAHVDGAIESAATNAMYVVMTHDHELDLYIVQQILARNDFFWLGLIGSKTKYHRFRHRLNALGFAPEKINRLTCPIGLPGISSKEPAAIATSVGAQLLMLREQQNESRQQPQSEIHYLHLS